MAQSESQCNEFMKQVRKKVDKRRIGHVQAYLMVFIVMQNLVAMTIFFIFKMVDTRWIIQRRARLCPLVHDVIHKTGST